MDKRKFGVEIECGFEAPLPDCDMYCCENRYYEDYEDIGCGEVEKLLLKNGFRREWTHNIHPDGSGVEIPSPVLQGQGGINELKEVMQCLRENGAYVTEEDGMHVHHDAPEFRDNLDLQRTLIRSWAANEDHIRKLVAEDRLDNYYCARWRPEDLRNLDEDQPAWGHHVMYDDYKSLTLRQLARGHGTIEIRLHQGCLDGDTAEDWVKFGQAFLRKVLKDKKPLAPVEEPVALLNRIRVAEKAKARLAEKCGGGQ